MERDRQENGAEAGGRRTKWIVAGTVAVLAIGGIGVAGAMGAGDGVGRYVMNAGFHHGGHFAGRGLGRALDAVDASTAQEERIWAIVDAARADLRPLMREFRDTHGAVAGLVGAETLDRAAAETLRAERIAAIDEASKRLTEALLDAAEVLTPEQRAELVEHFGQRGHRPRW